GTDYRDGSAGCAERVSGRSDAGAGGAAEADAGASAGRRGSAGICAADFDEARVDQWRRPAAEGSLDADGVVGRNAAGLYPRGGRIVVEKRGAAERGAGRGVGTVRSGE